ncbi:MAG: hypothetical protein JRG73_16485 [Deltaproteobacteria bacterium]|nr:hypothetical protein [Deltaproteobacteria bacterium]
MSDREVTKQSKKTGTVYVVGRARFPTRKPGLWTCLGVYPTETLAKQACYDKWCCYTRVKLGMAVDLTITYDRGTVQFRNQI